MKVSHTKSILDLTWGIWRRIYAACIKGRRINSVSLAAEVLFWRLHCVADDFGTFEADATYVKVNAVPLRPEITIEQVPGLLKQLADKKLVILFECGGEHYGEICQFEKVQPAGKNGRRVQRFPRRNPQMVIPGESKIIQESPSETGVPQEQEHKQEQRQEQQSAAQAPPTPTRQPFTRNDVQTILAEYPLKVALAGAINGVEVALSELAGRGIADPVVWLKEKVRRYAASHEGRTNPKQARYWFIPDRRFDDDEKAWEAKTKTKTAPEAEQPAYVDAPLTPEEFRRIVGEIPEGGVK